MVVEVYVEAVKDSSHTGEKLMAMEDDDALPPTCTYWLGSNHREGWCPQRASDRRHDTMTVSAEHMINGTKCALCGSIRHKDSHHQLAMQDWAASQGSSALTLDPPPPKPVGSAEETLLREAVQTLAQNQTVLQEQQKAIQHSLSSLAQEKTAGTPPAPLPGAVLPLPSSGLEVLPQREYLP